MFHGFSPWDGAASPCKIFLEWSLALQLSSSPATPGIPQTLRDGLFNAPLDQHVGQKFTPIPCLHTITFTIILFPFSVSFLQLTYADISIFDFLNNILLGGKTDVPKELDKFPLLAGHYTRVLNVPEIKAWIEKRPQTTG